MIHSTHKQALHSCTSQHISCAQLSGRLITRHPRPFSSSNPLGVGRQGSQLPRRDSPSPCSAGFGGFGFGKKKADAKPNGANNSKKCPCDLGEEYVLCCGRYHGSKSAVPPTPEAALRARYAAYARRELKYIMDTTHPDNPARNGSTSTTADGQPVKSTFEQDVRISADFVQFKGLRLLGCSVDTDGREARVTCEYDYVQARDIAFRKIMKQPGPLQTQREVAVFRLEDSKGWLHLGSAPEQHEQQVEAAEGAAAEPAAA